MYLFPELISLLQPKLLRDLKPGTRIVIHDFAFATWTPDHTESFHAPEKYFGSGGDSRVSLWIVPATAGGRWKIMSPGRLLIDKTIGFTVGKEVESHGLDIAEHGESAYHY
jgi:hypothetical protein